MLQLHQIACRKLSMHLLLQCVWQCDAFLCVYINFFCGMKGSFKIICRSSLYRVAQSARRRRASARHRRAPTGSDQSNEVIEGSVLNHRVGECVR